MKKKTYKIAVFVLAMTILTISASAYYITVKATYGISKRGVVGFSTVTANTNEGLKEMVSQATVLDLDGIYYGGNIRTLTNPTVDTLKVDAAAGKLVVGEEYYAHAYGRITWPTRYEDMVDIKVDEDHFIYKEFGTKAVPENHQNNQQREKLRNEYYESRADYILEKFGLNPSEYSHAWYFDLLNYVDANEYQFIQKSLNILPGTTAPSFFVNNDTDVIYGVCQDDEAINYLYKFCLAEDGTWSMSGVQHLQDVGVYQDTYQSFAEYQTLQENRLEDR